MTLLRVEHLSKSFGPSSAIEDLSFAISPGTIHSIIGPNGAGKTTLFNLISGLYRPTSGTIWFDDADITALPPHRRARCGLSRTFQNLQIFLNLSALDNVMVGYHLACDGRFLPSLLRLPSVVRRDRDYRERAVALMRFVGLEAFVDAAADAMPYGALKRLELARALAVQPKMLLLDEPAAGLNPKETAELDFLIQQIAAQGITVVLVEHDMRLVWSVSNHILVLDHGRKLAEGTGWEIRHNEDVVAAYLGEGGRHR
ncbi:MAG: ABC transporter ATP-binding protein [Rhodospirillales bacterium]|nr:ABC transporter ATP-binding protein [Rhodospirillales bacterium]